MLKKHLISDGKLACGLRLTARRMCEQRCVLKKSEATCQYCNPPEKV